MDEVGFMIKEIKADGTFRVVELGGWNPLVSAPTSPYTLVTVVSILSSGFSATSFLRASGEDSSLPSVSDIVFDAGFANQEGG
ncbi:MAG: hypothetical protein ACLRYA_05290 [Streptococcus thermophilus]